LELNKRPQDHFLIACFSQDLQVLTSLTNDQSELKDGIEQISAYGQTALNNAVYETAEFLERKSKEQTSMAIIALTDGIDEPEEGQEVYSDSDVDKELREGALTVHFVDILGMDDHGVVTESQKAHAKQWMERVADSSGGIIVRPKVYESVDRGVQDLKAAYQDLFARTSGKKYVLYISPDNEVDDDYNRIKVTVKRPDVTAHYRSGYFTNSKAPSQVARSKP
jgi:hypothetical protein